MSSYVKTVRYLGKGCTDSIMSVQFYDGLGRPSISATNGLAGNGVFTYSLQTYDNNDRECHKWYPIAGNGSIACQNTDDIANMSRNRYKDDYAFTAKTYDALNRVLTISRGGKAWEHANKVGRSFYRTNSSSEVKRYIITNAGISQNGYWSVGCLKAETLTDEDGHSTTAFKDMHGNIVMENKAGDITYYVYNDRNLLTYVLTPLYQSNNSIDNCAYVYNYDSRNRVISKKIPGCAATSYTYDSADRVVTITDPLLAEQGRKRFFLYDALGRICIQGSCSSYSALSENPVARYISGSTGILQTGYTADVNICNAKIEIVNYYDDYSFFASYLFSNFCGENVLHSNTSSNELTFSSNGSKTADIVATNNGNLQFSTYFYDARGRCIEEKHSDCSGNINETITAYSHTDKPTSVTKTIYISQQSPVIAYGSSDLSYKSEFSISSLFTYNSHNDMLESESIKYGNSAPVTVSCLAYDSIGRVIRDERSAIGDIIAYKYDLHGWTEAITSRFFSENLYYANGPITKQPCWNGNISSLTWKSSDGNSHGYYFRYNDRDMLHEAGYRSGADNYADGGSKADRYNEVVSSFTPDGAIQGFRRRGRSNNSSIYAYIDDLTYEYDGQQVRNITDVCAPLSYANAFEYSDSHVGTSTEPDFEYNTAGMLIKDRDKGIRKITYNNIGLVDSILFESGAKVVYTYAMTGEKLRVRHYAAPQSVVSPRAGIGGALIPTRPGVPTISYDDEEYYGADLVKYSHVVGTDQQLPTYKYFFGNGYVALNSIAAQPTYYYYTKDHLGNVRSVVKANTDGTAEEVQHTAYYPFGGIIPDLSRGTEVQNRLYNGKELDRSNNLWWYDYGARQYIVDAPRFNGSDPMCEKYYPFNYYVYCLNNPVKFIDPDGRLPHNWFVRKNKRHDIKDFTNVANRKIFDDRIINIFAHGIKYNAKGNNRLTEKDYMASAIEIAINENKGIAISPNNKENVKYLSNKIKYEDPAFSNKKAGNPIMVLHSCATSEFALELSKNEEFKDIIIIAPTANVSISDGPKGAELVNAVYNLTTGETHSGNWNVYLNGEQVVDDNGQPITYPYDALPGSKGFDYKFDNITQW